MRRLASPLVLGWLLVAGCGFPPAARSPRPAPSASASGRLSAVRDELALGLEALEQSRYAEAETHLIRAATGSRPAAALLALARLELETGRYAEAEARCRGLRRDPEVAVLLARALRAQGKLREAESVLGPIARQPEARRARVLLGEILIELGRRNEAEPFLRSLIDDYNQDRIGESDAVGLALVGRAAHLLRSPQDANDAYNQAERTGRASLETLLWRVDLFLEAHDPAHAEQVLKEVLARAPNHPEALARLAQVKLAQTYDFATARELAGRALAHHPRLGRARFVLAGLALRDMELELAEQELAAGLEHNPRDLELLSLRATVRFLADDRAGFARAVQAVLDQSPGYSRLYQIVAEYAEWEHRYQEVAELMREAIRLDPLDGKAHAELGINLIRAGDESGGLEALRRAFSLDPFNVRVYNTLNLYEKAIPAEYLTVRRGRFVLRYHRAEHKLLDRYVPGWLEQAWRTFEAHYRYQPPAPIGVELYPDSEHFAVRTTGLPNVGIQGVSFGRTFAVVTPQAEPLNLGMTLWHELAHVFHIERSHYRVPRWFTEGLAEYETRLARPEWKREHDRELWRALAEGRLPPVEQMNRAFTHARDLSEMTVAYYASTQLVAMLAERYGMEKLSRMLELWAEGRRTGEVIRQALGLTPAELDRDFREWLRQRLVHYAGQFLPVEPSGSLEQLATEARQHPRDLQRQVAHGLGLVGAGELDQAAQVLRRVQRLDPMHPDVRWLSVQLARARGDRPQAELLLRQLVADGHDGYTIELALGTVLFEQGELGAARTALEAAHRFDPGSAEPLRALAQIASRLSDTRAEIVALRTLAELEEHDSTVFRRLLRVLLGQGLVAEAVQVGEAALRADVLGLETHLLLAEALARAGNATRARFELESAVLCEGETNLKAEAHLRLARAYLAAGQRGKARQELELVRKLEPNHPGLTGLRP